MAHQVACSTFTRVDPPRPDAAHGEGERAAPDLAREPLVVAAR